MRVPLFLMRKSGPEFPARVSRQFAPLPKSGVLWKISLKVKKREILCGERLCSVPHLFFFGVISTAGALNFAARCDPSQNGLFFDCPQPQR
jgi:hypothetical protein